MESGEEGNVVNAVVPLLKLICVSVIGLVLVHPKVDLVPKSTLKLLSKLVFALFLPCLIFTKLGPSITLKNLLLWWFIPVNVILSTAIGCILGLVVAIICRPPPEYFRFTIIMTAFGNTGNLPLAIVASVCHNTDILFGPDCSVTGSAYVAFSQWVAVILVYTLVYHMMEPPLEYYEIVEGTEIDEIVEGTEIDEIVEEEEEEELPANNDLSRPLLVEAEWPDMGDKETEYCKTPFIARLFNSISSVSQTNFPDFDTEEEGERNHHHKSIRCLAESKMVNKVKIVVERTPIRHILQPPTIASLLAVIIGLVPQLKTVVFGDDAALSFITDSLEILSEAMVPSAMLILGGMLAEGPKDSNLGIRTTIGIIIARLLVLPVIGFGIIHLADKLNFLAPADRLYRFVLLLNYAVPSAILLGAIASLRGYAVREASALLFWQHICAIFSLSFYMIIYFKFLVPYS